MDLYEELGINGDLVVGDLHDIAFQIVVLSKDHDSNGQGKSALQKRAHQKKIEQLKVELKIAYLRRYFKEELEQLAVKEVIKYKDASTRVIVLLIFASILLGALAQSGLQNKFGFSLITFLQNIINP
ncbi:hypothetical protein HN958_03900 [Candidatus Falkowbacteria bacterium]|jgi:hypothetical protein|nr:hypothetical protein [Candidatus Falkowbacteria bacterium]MBT7913778.1 hypothetical protein [Candidatus Bathyarchaeota archaeon]